MTLVPSVVKSSADGLKKSRSGRKSDDGSAQEQGYVGVLGKWRQIVKNGVASDSCTAEMVAFLQRENARCPKDAEGAPEAVLS